MTSFRTLTFILSLFCAPAFAIAQQAGASTAQPIGTQGPMTVERMHTGFLITPGVKITDVARTTSELVGGSAGWVTDRTFFIGAGGYWLANQSSTRKMGYGGLVVQWLARTDERVGFSVKGLFGAGAATVPGTATQVLFPPNYPFGPDGHMLTGDPLMHPTMTTTTVRLRQEFFVAEPEANLTLRLTKRVRLAGGVGYRAVSRDHRDGTQLSGVTGTVGLQWDVGM
ncbi:MAG: hypothetical protein HY048_19005 [Acidobacteria bacterium]|nr:hypothetical protein [Acidobacteriota bacterium]